MGLPSLGKQGFGDGREAGLVWVEVRVGTFSALRSPSCQNVKRIFNGLCLFCIFIALLVVVERLRCGWFRDSLQGYVFAPRSSSGQYVKQIFNRHCFRLYIYGIYTCIECLYFPKFIASYGNTSECLVKNVSKISFSFPSVFKVCIFRI